MGDFRLGELEGSRIELLIRPGRKGADERPRVGELKAERNKFEIDGIRIVSVNRFMGARGDMMWRTCGAVGQACCVKLPAAGPAS